MYRTKLKLTGSKAKDESSALTENDLKHTETIDNTAFSNMSDFSYVIACGEDTGSTE